MATLGDSLTFAYEAEFGFQLDLYFVKHDHAVIPRAAHAARRLCLACCRNPPDALPCAAESIHLKSRVLTHGGKSWNGL